LYPLARLHKRAGKEVVCMTHVPTSGLGLAGKVVIVTGGAHGIGKAYSERLAAEGARVVIADIDGEGAAQVAQACQAKAWEVIGVRTDVSELASCQAAVRTALQVFGRVDALVNNAAIFSRIPMTRARFTDISEEEWDRMFQVNVKGTWNMCKAVVPLLEQQNSGHIVNIASSTVYHNQGTRIHYVSSKAAIVGFTRTLAREVGAHFITVNCVCPGSTLSDDEPTEESIAYRSRAVAARAIPRLQVPADLAGVVAFLCSDLCNFMTGQTVIVDGGQVTL
ncbi:MAG: SDR family oxidoreductase, partial [Alicyclobacillus sp.]|nr:SDR family oxidoreductase [Alicyclobacillus sp.]